MSKIEITAEKNADIALKIFFSSCGKYSNKKVLRISPPSVAEIGKAVKIPIMRFIYPKIGFLKTKNIAASKKLIEKPAMSTEIFLAMLKFSGKETCIPKGENSISFGLIFTHNRAKICPNSCKAENKTATDAIPFLSTIKNRVSTAKKSGDILSFVLSTVNSIIVQDKAADQCFSLQR